MHPGRKLFAVACCLLVYLLLGATSAGAQAIHEGKVTGTVMGEDQAVMPGASVEISSPALMGGVKSTTTTRTGTYLFLNLPIGRYTVTASLAGFKTIVRENIGVSADTTVTVDFVLPVGSFNETVTVTAEGPRVDAKTATVDAQIDRNMIAKLPTTRDAFYDLALTTPGMFDSSSSNTLPSPTAYGSATNENVFLINGINATNPEAGSFGTLLNVNYDAVEEVRIVGLGSKAEYGSFSGVAVDVVTKSGSNQFHGTGAYYSKLGSPASNQPAPGADLGAPWLYMGEGEQLAGDVKSDWEASFTLGGPIAKDKVWFFGAYDYLRSAELPPRWSLQNESWGRYADAKVSFLPSKKHLIWGAYHYENNDGNGWSWGSEPAWDTSMTYGAKTKKHSAAGQWQWTATGTTVVSAKYLGFWTDDNPYIPQDAPNHPGYINWWKWSDYGINGAFPYVDNQKANRQTIQADMSHYTEKFLGTHDLKFGVQYTKGRGNRQEGYFQNYANFLYPYRWTQNVGYMQSWYGDNGLIFYNQKYSINPFLTVRTADTRGMFFDDRWSPTKRLTINLGLRYDYMTAKYEKGKVYEMLTSPDEINAPPPVIRDRAASDNIYDFRTWAPRVGVSYQLTEDGKTVARAAYGRYYTPLTVENLRRFGPDVPTAIRTTQFFEVGPWDTVDTNGDGEIDSLETRDAARRVYGLTPFDEQSTTYDQSWTLNVADNLKDQFVDELSLNLEREIARNMTISAGYIFKHSGNLFANVPINRVTGQEWEYERKPYTVSSGQTFSLYSVVHKDYNGDGVIDGADIQWIGDNNTSRVQNMPTYDGVKAKRDYHGLQFVLNKRYSDRWQAMASFLYSTSSGMARRSLRQDINVEGPMFWDDNWMGSLNQTVNNMDGPLPFTPKYEFKLNGSYLIPVIEFDVGARLRVNTGRPVWKLETYDQLTQWGGPPTGVIDVGGGNIVAVTEPVYLPTQTMLDLHFDKVINFPKAYKLHLVVDGFNIFNTYTATDVDTLNEYGKVTAIPRSRRFRFGAKFEF